MGTNTDRAIPIVRDEAPVLCIVDDDDGARQLVRDVAEEAGWVTYEFGRIADLRQFLNERRPALLVLDDDLPDGRGGDLARELRRDPALGDVHTIVCTAAPPSRRKEIASWAAVLPKPFDLEDFERHLRSRARAENRGAGEASAG